MGPAVRDASLREAPPERRLEGREGASQAAVLGAGNPGLGKSKCKGPETDKLA